MSRPTSDRGPFDTTLTSDYELSGQTAPVNLPLSFPMGPSETTNPALRRGIERHRYGDSNPGFRTENPAS